MPALNPSFFTKILKNIFVKKFTRGELALDKELNFNNE
jgi:hypothetical protein